METTGSASIANECKVEEKVGNDTVGKRLLLLENVVDDVLFLAPGIGREVVLTYPCADH